ncbi:MAG TPA: substrate-binding domain-containing protein [Acetobacteraceae bacterium]|nr:substrate-binding domain-containing protein [Acetobacteraceae bacterium]
MPRDQMRDSGVPPPAGGGLARRGLMQALPATAVLLVAAAPAAQAADVAELVVACDTTLGPVLRLVARAYAESAGVRVNVFPTPPGLILPQLERQVQNDIVMTQPPTIAAAVQANVAAQDAARGAWRNPLVLAMKRGANPPTDQPIAVSDPTPASDMDGPAILARLGLASAPMLGVIDTDSVAALVLDGTARAGLLHMTDVHARPGLQIVRTIPPDIAPPISYAVAVTKLARRPDPAGFVAFLLAPPATVLLAANGLETAS